MEAQAIVSAVSLSEISPSIASWALPHHSAAPLMDFLPSASGNNFQHQHFGGVLARLTEPSVTISHLPQDLSVPMTDEPTHFYNSHPPNFVMEKADFNPEDSQNSDAKQQIIESKKEESPRQQDLNDEQRDSSPETEEKPPEPIVTRASVIGIAYSSHRIPENIIGSVDSPPKSEHSDRRSEEGGDPDRPYESVTATPPDQQQILKSEEFVQAFEHQQQMQALHQQLEYQNLSGLTPIGAGQSPTQIALQQQQLELQYQQAIQQAHAQASYDGVYYGYDPKTGLQYPYGGQYPTGTPAYCPPTPPFNSPQGFGNQQQVYRYS